MLTLRFPRLGQRCIFKLIIYGGVAFLLLALFGYWFYLNDDSLSAEDLYDLPLESEEKIIPLDEEMQAELKKLNLNEENAQGAAAEEVVDPVILWWTHFTGEPGTSRQCGQDKCFFTNNRIFKTHKMLKVFMFYGTDFDPTDLPLPRSKHHQWALLHEESPKNNFILCFEPVLSLFNFTSTCRRESDFPLSTQHLISLEWLSQSLYTKTVSEKNRYQKVEGLAPIAYVQSDCDPPSDRDTYVKQLRKYINVDSYGACLNNKKLPSEISSPLEGMFHSKFYQLLSHYKFALAMENAVCEDYMTEKLWRPLMVGTVPIVFGSPKVQDFLPSNNSGVKVEEFKSAKHLADYIARLDKSDDDYDKLREWKRSGIVNTFLRNTVTSRSWAPDELDTFSEHHSNFVDGFECFVCRKIHENIRREKNGQSAIHQWGKADHFGCPRPARFDSSGRYGRSSGWRDFWSMEYDQYKMAASNLNRCILQGKSKCEEDFSSPK